MYCEFYQLAERPFNVTPDPKFLYLNARYREAIASLNYGITQRKGFITLIGEAGTGKTTLLNKLLEELDPRTKSVFIFNTNVTFEEILEYIFAEFDLPVHNGKKLYMLQRLNAFLLEELRAGGNVALLIDEAQDLEFSVLEDLRLLSNLETAKEKILQIVLSGQPELGQKLSNPILRQLRQRIGINCRLLPLSRDEITEYIQYRLQAAGCPDLKLFSREAEEQIYHFSRGIPRLVNVVCDNALVIGYALGKKRIGADVVTEAAADLLSVEPPTEEPYERPTAVTASAPAATPQNRWRARFGVMGLVVVAVVIGLLSVGRTMLHRRAEERVALPAQAHKLEVIRPGSEPRGTGVEGPPTRPVERVVDTSPEVDDRASGETDALRDERSTGVAQAGVAPVEPVPPKTSDLGDAAAPSARPALEADRVARNADSHAPSPPEQRPAELRETGGVPREEHLVVAAVPERAPPAPIAVAAPGVSPHEQRPADAAPAPSRDEGSPQRGEVAARAWPHRASEPRTETERGDQVETHDAATLNDGPTPRLDGIPFTRVVVRGGDSVSGIAMRKYGQAGYTILDLLKLANPEVQDIDLITVGQTIRLPDLGEGFPLLNDGSGHYAILVFSTPQAYRAAALQNALRSRGFESHVSGGSVGFGKPMFRVVVSGFTDRDEGMAVGKQLQKLFREDTRIAQLGE